MNSAIDSKIQQVRRRLRVGRFLHVLAWTGTVAIGLGCAALLACPWMGIEVQAGPLLAAAIGFGVLLAVAAVAWRGPGPLDAALEIDRVFGLKERVSTLVALQDPDRQSPAAHALAADVEHRLHGLDVQSGIRVSLPRHGWLPLLPLAAFLTLGIWGPVEWTQPAQASGGGPDDRKQVEEGAKLLAKNLAERRRELAEQDVDEDVEALTQEIQKVSAQLERDPTMGPKEAVAKLSDLARSVEERRKELAALDQLKRKLERLPNFEDGPVQKLAEALKDGDFQQAARELQKLQEKLKDEGTSGAEREKLARQLQEMADRMAQATEKSRQLEELARNLESQLKKGRLSPQEQERLREQLEQVRQALAQDASRMQPLQELADELARCARCMNGAGKPGEGDSLEQALSRAQEMLDELRRDDLSRQALDDLLADLDRCRGGMCQGQGRQGDGPGDGLGRGRGEGDRPEAPDETRARPTKTRVEMNKGEAVVTGRTSGRPLAGDSVLEIRSAVAEAARAAEDAVTRQRIPREYREHTREYFDRLNDSAGR